MIDNCPECSKPMPTSTCTCGFSRSMSRNAGRSGGSYAHSSRCSADGCICTGSISPGQVCRFHWGLDTQLWPAMTQRLRDNEWMLKLLRWLRTDGQGKAHADHFRKVIITLEARKVPELMPESGEPIGRWMARAEGWLGHTKHLKAQQPEREEIAA